MAWVSMGLWVWALRIAGSLLFWMMFLWCYVELCLIVLYMDLIWFMFAFSVCGWFCFDVDCI